MPKKGTSIVKFQFYKHDELATPFLKNMKFTTVHLYISQEGTHFGKIFTYKKDLVELVSKKGQLRPVD